MCAREPGRCGGARLSLSRSCVRDEGDGLDAGSEIEGKGDVAG
jgi:hypothetical protein